MSNEHRPELGYVPGDLVQYVCGQAGVRWQGTFMLGEHECHKLVPDDVFVFVGRDEGSRYLVFLAHYGFIELVASSAVFRRIG